MADKETTNLEATTIKTDLVTEKDAAAPPAVTEKPAETPAPPAATEAKKPSKEEEAAKLLADAKAAEERAAKEKADAERAERKKARQSTNLELSALAKQTRDAFMRTQAAQQAQEQAKQVEASVKAQLEEAQARLAKMENDPIAYMQERGITAEQLAERFIKTGTAEEALEKRLAELRAETKAATEKAAAAEAAAKKIVEEAQMREQQARQRHAYESAKALMLKEYDGGREEKYANLDAYAEKMAAKRGVSKDEVITSEFLTHIQRLKADPRYAQLLDQGAYEDHEILASLDDFYDGIVYRAPKTPAAPKTEEKPPLVQPKAEEKAEEKVPEVAGKEAPPTLTNDGASVVSGTLPDNFDKLSDREQNKIIMKMLREGTLPGLIKKTG